MTAAPTAGNAPAKVSTPEERAPLCVLIITHNEEQNLPFALQSVVGWAREVFVLDSGSTDRTIEIAEAAGARVYTQAWLGYAAQKNWGLENLPITAPWVLILDADEAVTPPLREELVAVATADRCPQNAFYVNRYFVFLNQRIRHCGYYPSWNIRFLRHGRAKYAERQVHEHMRVEGEVGYLRHDLEHHDRRGLEFYIAKHNRYSTLEAHEAVTGGGPPRGLSLWHPAERRQWIKTHVWPKLPAKWFWRWLYMYVFRCGFLDGVVGFHFCLFMAAYEHQITLKVKELEQAAPANAATRAPASGSRDAS